MKDKVKKIITIPLLVLLGCTLILGQISKPLLKNNFPSLITSKELFTEDPSLFISVKPLSEEESERYLNTAAQKHGYVPIQITIENQSIDPYLISKDSISLPLVEVKKIASKSTSSLPATIGLKVAGFIFWPFSIPSTMHGIKTLQNEQKLKKELSVKSVKEEIIPPYTVMNRVFFVDSKKYQDSFSVTLINQETLESKIFHVGKTQGEEVPLLTPIPMPLENYYLTHDK